MQLALTYAPAHAGADDWQEMLAWIRRAVDVVGHKEVAYQLDVQPSQLTDALNERERKDVKAKWIPVLLRLVPESLEREFFVLLAQQHSYEEPKKRKPRTPDEELREMRRLLAEKAPAMLDLIDKELGR
jgi:hypothetical protein